MLYLLLSLLPALSGHLHVGQQERLPHHLSFVHPGWALAWHSAIKGGSLVRFLPSSDCPASSGLPLSSYNTVARRSPIPGLTNTPLASLSRKLSLQMDKKHPGFSATCPWPLHPLLLNFLDMPVSYMAQTFFWRIVDPRGLISSSAYIR